MSEKNITADAEFIAVKALENGVQIVGLTRGDETKSHHIEKMDCGEVVLAQFTDKTSAIKVRGNAEIYTKFGKITSGRI